MIVMWVIISNDIFRAQVRFTFLLLQKQGSYSVQKQALTESLGSGRHIPVKEGNIKKKSSGMRPEWKKKYLVLSETEITYYPNITVSGRMVLHGGW